jgi:phosphohistidine phosphatase
VRLVIIRHGPAGNREEWEADGGDDRLRPLTAEGRKEMRAAAAGLARLVPAIDVLAASPLTRAAESAEIVGSIYRSRIVTLDSLAPDHEPEEVVAWLRDQPPAQTIGLVGHEPHLSTLVGYLLTERPISFIDLKKGGACLLDLKDPSSPGAGTLEWLLARRELKRLGEAG